MTVFSVKEDGGYVVFQAVVPVCLPTGVSEAASARPPLPPYQAAACEAAADE